MCTAKAISFGLFPCTWGRRDPADRLYTTTTSPLRQTRLRGAVAVHSLGTHGAGKTGTVPHGPSLALPSPPPSWLGSFQQGRHIECAGFSSGAMAR